MTSQLETLKAELAEAQEAAELAKLKAELAEAKRITRESKAAARAATLTTMKPLQLEQLRPALISGPLKDYRNASSAELTRFSRSWQRLLKMMRAPKHSMMRLTAEGLLRQLDVWYEDIGPKREWYAGASALMEWDKMEKGAKPTSDQANQRPSQPAATLESGSTTSTGAKVW